MAKKKAATTAPKTKVEPKPAAKVKDELSAKAKTTKKAAPAKLKVPAWLLPYPADYVVGTEKYVKLVEEFNKKFATAYNPFRVRPAVFHTIHEDMWKHYDPKQYKANLRRG